MTRPGQRAPAIELCGSFRFGGSALFTNLNLNLPAGQWCCLLGPSGIGKSTLLRLLAGLPTGGQFDGRIIADGQAVIPRVAYMAQSDLLAPWLSVRDNVLLGVRLRGEVADKEKAQALLTRVGLGEHASKRPRELSGGMRQRVALARTLMEQCPIVLLDEPFSALDARSRADMQELAFQLLTDSTVLLATHDPAEAIRLGHRIELLFDDGLHQHPVPASEPVRPLDSADTLQAQAALLSTLRAERR
ncbi:MAG: ABC transporter ATP-binding protein [Burkholderiaceae bacterium]